jgi:endonuclease/exonuclease/phosphatase family metal-dependent hydrolase
MRVNSFAVLALFVITVCCARRAPQGMRNAAGARDLGKEPGIRVLCYNIHHANPPSKPDVIDMAAVANVIKQEQPDLVALQEVDVYTTRSGKSLHQAEELARLTGMKAYFAKAIDYGGGEYGVAILSKHPMEGMQNHPLPTANGTGGELRTLASAVIILPGGKKILFGSTHLDAQAKDTNRLLQARKIVDILKPETLPVILAGDFNAVASTPIIEIFDSHFTRTCITNCGFTIPVINPNKTIDFIVYAPRDKFKVIQHSVIEETYASDHRPVTATLQLQ